VQPNGLTEAVTLPVSNPSLGGGARFPGSSHSSPLDFIEGIRLNMKSGRQRRGNAEQPGVRCPFYGFGWPAATRLLLQERGNRCGLALDRVQPCTMEETGSVADMQRCPMAEELAHFIRCASPVIQFATPEHPDGLPYAAWFRRTMSEAR
jgi:hypothetical protein